MIFLTFHKRCSTDCSKPWKGGFVTNRTRELLAGLGTAALLLIEHLILYDEQAAKDEPELTMLGSNILGVATIGAGLAVASRSGEETARYFTVVSIAGVVVVVLRLVRRTLRQFIDNREAAAHADGVADGALHYDQALRRAETRHC